MARVELKLKPGTALSEHAFELFVQRAFGELPERDTLTLLVTPELASILDQLAGDRLRFVPEHQSLGLPTKQWVTSYGTLNIVKLSGVPGVAGLLLDPVGVIR